MTIQSKVLKMSKNMFSIYNKPSWKNKFRKAKQWQDNNK